MRSSALRARQWKPKNIPDHIRATKGAPFKLVVLRDGLGLVLACDIRIAGRDAAFGVPEVRFGAAGGFAALRAAVGDGPARELALTARTFEAEEALRLGLLAEVVAAGEALSRALTIAAALAALPRRGLRLQTEIIRATAGLPLAEALAYEAAVFRREVLAREPGPPTRK